MRMCGEEKRIRERKVGRVCGKEERKTKKG